MMRRSLVWARMFFAGYWWLMADEMRAHAQEELDCPPNSSVHAFGRLHWAVADLWRAIGNAIAGDTDV